MIAVEALEKKYFDYWRPGIFEGLRAADWPDPEAQADRIAKVSARAYVPALMATIVEVLRNSFSDSPQGLSILFGPEPRPEGETRAEWIARAAQQKADQRAWIERQVAAALDRMTVDDIALG